MSKPRADGCDEPEGETFGYTIYESSNQHPHLLGPDGEPLRITHRNRIGFDLTPRRKKDRA